MTFLNSFAIFLYLLALVVISVHFSRKTRSAAEFDGEGRGVHPLFVGLSLYATMFSAISYVAFPGEMIKHGPTLMLAYIASLPIIYYFVCYLVIPKYMNGGVRSAYELLELKLGGGIRRLGSVLFLAMRYVWMAVMLYTTGMVLQTTLSLGEEWMYIFPVIISSFTVAYAISGIRAVVYVEALQFFVLLGGILITILFIYSSIWAGGIGNVTAMVDTSHWQPREFFSLDPGVRVTVVGTVVGSVIWWICTSGSDQIAVQRYLISKDLKKARRTFLNNNLADVTVTILLMLTGYSLLVYFQANPALIEDGFDLVDDADRVFPLFMSAALPDGLAGVVVAGLLAATMSSVGAGINATSVVISHDLLGGRKDLEHGSSNNGNYLKRTRYCSVGSGILIVLGAYMIAVVPGNLVEVTAKTINLFLTPLYGLFFLAFFVKGASPFSAIQTVIYGFYSSLLIAYWGELTGREAISFQWIMPLSFVVVLMVAFTASRIPVAGRTRGWLWCAGLVYCSPLIIITMIGAWGL